MIGQNNKKKKRRFVFWLLFLLLIIFGVIFLAGYFSNKKTVQNEPEVEIGIDRPNEIIKKNESFVFDVYVDTRGRDINATDVMIYYDVKKIEVVGIKKDKSIFKYFIDKKVFFDNKSGLIGFVGGVPNPGFRGRGILFSVEAKITENGKADIIVSDESKVALNDGNGSLAKSIIINADLSAN